VRLAAAEAHRRAPHRRQRTGDVRGDEPRAEQREHHHRRQPAEPLQPTRPSSKRSRGSMIQNSSSSMKKLTRKPSSPSRA